MCVYLTGVHLMGVCLIGVYLMGVYLTGVHPMGVYLINVHLTGAHHKGVHLIGVYVMGVHLTDVYFMDVYMFPNPKRLLRKPPDPPPHKRWSICRDLSCKIRVFALRDKRSLWASAIGLLSYQSERSHTSRPQLGLRPGLRAASSQLPRSLVACDRCASCHQAAMGG
jgi:hypothetical protein